MDIIKNLFSFIFNFYVFVLFSVFIIVSNLLSFIIIKVITISFFLILSLYFTCSLLPSSGLSRNFLLPFFHNFLTISFHEYQGCHVFLFFSCYQHFLIPPFLLSPKLSPISFFLISSLSFTCYLLSSSRLSHNFLIPFFL